MKITLDNWQKAFEQKILVRAKVYQRSGKVIGLDFDGLTIKANVHGSKDYDVTIYINGNGIDEMVCTCPYAMDGKHCKHMAAVLYEYQDSQDTVVTPQYPVNQLPAIDYQTIVENTDSTLVKSFFIDLLDHHPELAIQFLHSIHHVYTKDNIGIITTAIDALIDDADFDDLWKPYSNNNIIHKFKNRCIDFINTSIKPLIQQQEYDQTIICTTHFIDGLTIFDDDIQYCFKDVYHELHELLKCCLSFASSDKYQETLDWILGCRNQNRYCGLDSILLSCFKDDYSISKIEKYLMHELDKTYSMINENDFYKESSTADLMIKLIDTYPGKTIAYNDFIKRYDGFTNVKLDYIDRLMEQKQYDLAYENIEPFQKMSLPPDVEYLVDDWLLEIYEFKQDIESLRGIYCKKLKEK